MLPLSADPTFHYELLRVLGASRDLGADIAEVLGVAGRLVPGDFESWSGQFEALGRRVRTQAMAHAAQDRPISARNAFFRAASYFRSADFFLHGDPADPRILSLWGEQTACFDQAILRMDPPGVRLSVRADGFDVPAVFYRTPAHAGPRPTLLLCNGFDGSQEEMLHVCGLAALARGFNVVTFEGPGQPSVVREQGLPFIDEWEKVVGPVMDWCESQADVNARRIGLIGYSMGGWLAARAAACEPRLAATACVDGVFDVYAAYVGSLPQSMRDLVEAGEAEAVNRSVAQAMVGNSHLRWAVGHGCWAFGRATPFDFLARTKSMTLAGLAGGVACPVLVCEAHEDQFFAGQPQALAQALGPRATYRIFRREDSASLHCHVGASDFMNSVVMGWFEDHLMDASDAQHGGSQAIRQTVLTL